MRLYGYLFALAFALTFAACSTSYSIVGPDGSTVKGSMMNGAVSYSSGDACQAATPSPLTPSPPMPAPMTLKTICQGSSCVHLMVQDTSTPLCSTQVVNVRGNDITSYFAWLLGAGFGAWALLK